MQEKTKGKTEGKAASRYVVGIDLGTTNCALSYVDTNSIAGAATPRIETFSVQQAVSATDIEARQILPSFIYQAVEKSVKPEVGVYARQQASLSPGRVIRSAKSWLCHDGIDRKAAILPWQGAEDITPLSPVRATATILKHLRDAWDAAHPDAPLAEQELCITVPASFDDVARQLTLQAAQHVGLEAPTFLEEPQAAFYAWLSRDNKQELDGLKESQTVLVCDIGGGTSDFSLISIVVDQQKRLGFERKAVGQHLLLGGDNLDLALAHWAEARISPDEKLSGNDWGTLLAACQSCKELLLGPDAPESSVIHLSGSGRSLIGGSRQVTIERDELLSLLLDGFLPQVGVDDKPDKNRSGFQEFGLPYAYDSAMTKHLMAFLSSQGQGGEALVPDLVLFNGGFFESPIFRQRVLDCLAQWAGMVVPSFNVPQMALAVSQGAAYYGMIRRGWGQRIGGGLPRSTFIGVQNSQGTMQAICFAPAGMDEGQQTTIDTPTFKLRINQPVEFPLYTSSISSASSIVPVGEMVALDDLVAATPLRTILKIGKKKKRAAEIEVGLCAHLNALGVLEMCCVEVDGDRKWRLEFDTKAITGLQESSNTDQDVERDSKAYDGEQLDCAKEIIKSAFEDEGNADKLFVDVEKALNLTRWEWDLGLLRELWRVAFDLREHRGRSANHEFRWLAFVGFTLRPGYGVAMDDWRVKQVWELFHQGVKFHRNAQCQSDWWLLFNRIAGGLSAGQQLELAKEPLAALRAQSEKSKQTSTENKPRKGSKTFQRGSIAKNRATKMSDHEASSFWRLIGGLERLGSKTKLDLMKILIKKLRDQGADAVRGNALWAFGRLGARMPLYGPLNAVIAPKHIRHLLDEIIKLEHVSVEGLTEIAMIGRRCDDRFRELDNTSRDRFLTWLKSQKASEHTLALIETFIPMDAEEQGVVFGERLPAGLQMV